MDEIKGMDAAVGAVVGGSRAVLESAEAQQGNVRELADLVQQLADAVVRTSQTAAETGGRAAYTHKAATAASDGWLSLRPRLTHFRSLLTGVSLMSCLAPIGLHQEHSEQVTPGVVHLHGVATDTRDLPPAERYTRLADEAEARGEADAASWFRHKAQSQHDLEVLGLGNGMGDGVQGL